METTKEITITNTLNPNKVYPIVITEIKGTDLNIVATQFSSTFEAYTKPEYKVVVKRYAIAKQ